PYRAPMATAALIAAEAKTLRVVPTAMWGARAAAQKLIAIENGNQTPAPCRAYCMIDISISPKALTAMTAAVQSTASPPANHQARVAWGRTSHPSARR